jgi:hypothetical protein
MQIVAEWRIHIGAHKTATTHLQDTLALQREALAIAGVDYWPREIIRRHGAFKNLKRKSWQKLLSGHLYRSHWDDISRTLRSGPSEIVVSDESILGSTAGDLLGRTLYPDAESRLSMLTYLLRSANLHLFLSIRSFEEILPSAYAQHLRSRPVAEPFEVFRDSWLRQPPSWANLIGRIRATLPDARLNVWTLEEYRIWSGQIIADFSGTRAGQDLRLPPPGTTLMPSASAVALIKNVDHRLRGKDYRAEVEKICQQDSDQTKFSPLSADERTVLAKLYRADLERIKSLYPGALMKPSLHSSAARVNPGQHHQISG